MRASTCLCVVAGASAWLAVASALAGVGPMAPLHRAGALAMLAEREAALQKQLSAAHGAARDRARRIYRLSRMTSYEATEAAEASLQRARVLGLGAVALRRDIDEARLIEAELERVRAEQRLLSLRSARSEASDALQCARPSFAAPVSGAVLVRFGVGKDTESGALAFSPGVRFRVTPGTVVRAIGPGTVRRVIDDAREGQVVIVGHQEGWTSILTGLGSVTTAPGAVVNRGDPLGSVPARAEAPLTLEIWQGPSPVDPAAVMKLP